MTDESDKTGVSPAYRGAKDAILAGAAGGLIAKTLEASNKKIAAAALIPGVVVGTIEYLGASREQQQISGLMDERDALKASNERSQKQLGAIEKLTHQEQVAARREDASPEKGRG